MGNVVRSSSEAGSYLSSWVVVAPVVAAVAVAMAVAVPRSQAADCIPAKSVTCSDKTIVVSGVYDGEGETVPGIGGGSGEGSPLVIEVTDGGTVQNVTIGRTTSAIACLESCTLRNIHWTHVGDDAATALGGAGTTMTVVDSTVDSAFDKAFQHNGAGTVVLENVRLGSVGHIYASCGSCGSVGPRKVIARNVHADSVKYDGFAIQTGDSEPELSGVTVDSGEVCSWYDGDGSLHKPC